MKEEWTRASCCVVKENVVFLWRCIDANFFLFVMFSIDAVVTKHFKVFFRDMNNKTFDEIHCWNAFSYRLIVFVSGVMKSNHIAIIIINTGSCNYRTPKIVADIFDGNIRSTFIMFCSDIEAIRIFFVQFIFKFFGNYSAHPIRK